MIPLLKDQANAIKIHLNSTLKTDFCLDGFKIV